MNISLVMIVKNEEGGLRKAVESALPLIDEVIIGVDSKSSDGTLQIAEELGKVYRFDWCDDFSKTRNEGLSRSNGEWNLILDGHEHITQYPEMDLIEIEDNIDSLRAEVTMENGEVSSSERILRKGIRYENEVHNEPETKYTLLIPDLKIIHDRKLQTDETVRERNEQRTRMNEKMLERDTFRSNYYLGQLYRATDVKKSIKHYKRAIERIEENTHKAIIQCTRYYLAQMLYEDGQWMEALRAVANDDLMEFRYLQGLIHVREKNYSIAIMSFIEALTFKKLEASSRPVVDLEFEIYNALSQCFYQLGRKELAVSAAQSALEYKDDEGVRENIKVFKDQGLATEEMDSKYYDEVYSKPYNTSKYEELYKVVMSLLRDNPKVLEIGCGIGDLGKKIVEKGFTYTGFDFSKEAVKQAKKLCPLADFRVGNAYDEGSYKHNYDTVIALEVLEHVDDLKVLSMIKSGTIFIGSVPTYSDKAHLRVYRDKKKDIVERFKDYLEIEKILFSQQKGLYIIKGIIK